ncbi:tetratricopeptide repeat protein [Kiritimatiellaeota bacterium B1221]|nr:tetratricopeptide repeat protein [Kiritimatiellaeota bacterium B1221]
MRIILITLLWMAVLKGSLTAQSSDPFSPTVSRSESEILQKAIETAEADPLAAMNLLKEEITEDSSAALEFTLANLTFQEAQYPETVASYKQALRKFPDFRDAKINLGRVYLVLEQTKDAIKVYQELARDGVADGETYTLLGHAFMMEEKAVSAETAYRHALMLNDEGLEARQGLLNCLLAQNRNAEVLELSAELIAEDVSQQSYWAVRANAQLSLDQYEEAARSLEQARRLGVADAEMLSMLGQLYLQKELPGVAVGRLQEAFAQGDLSLRRKEQAIRGLMQLGRYDDAEQLMSEIKDENVQWMNTLMAKVKMEQGDAVEASRLLKIGLEQDPLDGELLLMLAELQLEKGEAESARLTLERLSRIDGYEADALIEMARMDVDLRQWASAIKLLERAMVFEEQPHLQNYIEQLRRMDHQ